MQREGLFVTFLFGHKEMEVDWQFRCERILLSENNI